MSSWLTVVNRLVAVLPTLSGWDAVTLYDGPPVTAAAPKAYMTVGFVVGEDASGTFETSYTPGGGWTEENGQVRSELVCWTGGVDLPTVRAQAFALADALNAWVVNDPTLGVLPSSSTSHLAVDVHPAQTTAGAEQRLVLTLTYFSRG